MYDHCSTVARIGSVAGDPSLRRVVAKVVEGVRFGKICTEEVFVLPSAAQAARGAIITFKLFVHQKCAKATIGAHSPAVLLVRARVVARRVQSERRRRRRAAGGKRRGRREGRPQGIRVRERSVVDPAKGAIVFVARKATDGVFLAFGVQPKKFGSLAAIFTLVILGGCA